MEKNDTRYKEFLFRIKKPEQFKEELSHIYEEEYQEEFEDILLIKKEKFLQKLNYHIKLLLKDKYSSKCLEYNELISYLDEFENLLFF